MSRGFSLVECVVYILCLTIIFGLLGEMIFGFYIRINKDIKEIQQFTNSIVCLNTIVHDLCQAVSTDATMSAEHGTIILGLKTGRVTWALNQDKLYRYFKKFKPSSGRSHKTASLMMRNVLDFDVINYLQNHDQVINACEGFKIVLKLDNRFNNFEHHVAIRRLSVA